MENRLDDEVLEFLCQHCSGRDNAVKAKHIALSLRSNLRDINQSIRILRKRGILIGSAKIPPYGYYIPVTEDEVRGYLDSFKKELYDMLNTFNRQKRAVRDRRELARQRFLRFTGSGQMEFTAH